MKRFGASVEHIVHDPLPALSEHDGGEALQEELEHLRVKVQELSEEVGTHEVKRSELTKACRALNFVMNSKANSLR
jgi:hypothetical protein